jgi:hypothetical protein
MSKTGQSNVAVIANIQINKVIWNEKMLEDYLDTCIIEIHAGNRSGIHFNKTGWKNVIDKFNEKTGKQYYYKQLKNKYDSLKKSGTFGRDTGEAESGPLFMVRRVCFTLRKTEDGDEHRYNLFPLKMYDRGQGMSPCH